MLRKSVRIEMRLKVRVNGITELLWKYLSALSQVPAEPLRLDILGDIIIAMTEFDLVRGFRLRKAFGSLGDS